MNLKIIQNRKIFFVFSSILVLVSLFGVIFFGLKFGIDFTGGSLVEVRFSERLSKEEIVSRLGDLTLNNLTLLSTDRGTWIFRMSEISEDTHQEMLKRLFASNEQGNDSIANQKVQIEQVEGQPIGIEINANAEEMPNKGEELRFDSVGPAIGEELKQKSLYAMIVVLVAIILYVAWAFRKVSTPVSSWKYGIIATIALFHDVFITIGLFAFLGKFLAVEINTPFIAALLTILGYSVNDTIVVFDRIRENLKGVSMKSFEEIVNNSVNQTMRRSINTSLTTLLAIGALFFLGGQTIQYFALALLVGITIGTYSSIFLASPLLVIWQKHRR